MTFLLLVCRYLFYFTHLFLPPNFILSPSPVSQYKPHQKSLESRDWTFHGRLILLFTFLPKYDKNYSSDDVKNYNSFLAFTNDI